MSANVTELVAYVPPPSPEVDVYTVCQRIEQWAATADDVFTLKDNKSKLAAIDQYLASTSKEGRNQIAATMRRLETRIGDLIGPGEHGGDRRSPDQERHDTVDPLALHERKDFRKMAAHPDVVEAVIADSTDDDPASRRKVIAAIREKENPEAPAPMGLDNSREGVALRVATANELAAAGHTSKQIAARLGLNESGMDAFRKRHGVEVPADKFAGRTKAIDSNRVIGATVDSVRDFNTGLNLVDYEALDGDLIDEWVASLKAARRALYTLIEKLEKEKTRRASE